MGASMPRTNAPRQADLLAETKRTQSHPFKCTLLGMALVDSTSKIFYLAGLIHQTSGPGFECASTGLC